MHCATHVASLIQIVLITWAIIAPVTDVHIYTATEIHNGVLISPVSSNFCALGEMPNSLSFQKTMLRFFGEFIRHFRQKMKIKIYDKV